MILIGYRSSNDHPTTENRFYWILKKLFEGSSRLKTIFLIHKKRSQKNIFFFLQRLTRVRPFFGYFQTFFFGGGGTSGKCCENTRYE